MDLWLDCAGAFFGVLFAFSILACVILGETGAQRCLHVNAWFFELPNPTRSAFSSPTLDFDVGLAQGSYARFYFMRNGGTALPTCKRVGV